MTSTSWIMKTLHPYLSKTPARFCSSEAWLSALRTRSRALRLDICMTSSSTWLRSLLVHKRSSSLCRSSCCMEKLKCRYMHADLLVCACLHMNKVCGSWHLLLGCLEQYPHEQWRNLPILSLWRRASRSSFVLLEHSAFSPAPKITN